MTQRWYPVSEEQAATAGVSEFLSEIRAAGMEVCLPRDECSVHPGEPKACYLCL